MFRQFASKEIVNVAMVVTGFTVVCCILLYTFVKADLTKGTVSYEASLADTIYRSMRYSMLQSDFGSLEQIIKNIGEQERVQYARIYQRMGIVRFSSNESEIGSMVARESTGCVKCHNGPDPATAVGSMDHSSLYLNEREGKVLSMIVPIPNDPDCSGGDCHYHPPEKTLLGVLEVGVSQEYLDHCLSLLRWRMIAFCAMILVLTLGGVTALLWRTVMLPLTQIAEFAENRAEGKSDKPPPRGEGDIKRLADAIGKMVPDIDKAGPEKGDGDDGSRDQGRT
jgi:HAMP domain-containing protein